MTMDELDRGLLLSLTGSTANPWKPEHWNLTAQLLVDDLAPAFARTLKNEADHHEPRKPFTRLG